MAAYWLVTLALLKVAKSLKSTKVLRFYLENAQLAGGLGIHHVFCDLARVSRSAAGDQPRKVTR